MDDVALQTAGNLENASLLRNNIILLYAPPDSTFQIYKSYSDYLYQSIILRTSLEALSTSSAKEVGLVYFCIWLEPSAAPRVLQRLLWNGLQKIESVDILTKTTYVKNLSCLHENWYTNSEYIINSDKE